MLPIPLTHAWVLAIVLFGLGLGGLLARRNLVFMLMSVEIMLNAAGLAFITAAARWGQADGQIMFILILALAAAEVSVGLALILQMFRRCASVDADAATALRD
ncbi:MAG: NADH-quinone oxidoreductase subunit NuoK [Steroidobacteraceae bacterium]